MKIAGIGLNGLIGSRIVELLGNTYQFENVSRASGVDITDKHAVEKAIMSSDAEAVLILTAKTDVDGCETDKTRDTEILGYNDSTKQEDAWQQEKTAWAINVYGVRNIIEACQKTQKKIVYVSTDFVFDGENAPESGYSEDDTPNPINWYGKTKYEGEKIVQASGLPFLILRPAYPYRAQFEQKKDFLRAIMSRLQAGQSVAAITDHVITPTFIDDFASVFQTLVEKDQTGIFHIVGSEWITPYDASLAIADVFHYDKSLVASTTRAQYFAGKADRPYRLALKNDKIKQLGITMRTFGEGLEVVERQLKNL